MPQRTTPGEFCDRPLPICSGALTRVGFLWEMRSETAELWVSSGGPSEETVASRLIDLFQHRLQVLQLLIRQKGKCLFRQRFHIRHEIFSALNDDL